MGLPRDPCRNMLELDGVALLITEHSQAYTYPWKRHPFFRSPLFITVTFGSKILSENVDKLDLLGQLRADPHRCNSTFKIHQLNSRYNPMNGCKLVAYSKIQQNAKGQMYLKL